ncbi:DNA primase [Fervidicola ferrireducens]|uniref:DNA primase n=1 Tax=Fervidicola ferrireducens TaxID=520764 RepID=A0A140L2Z0_9FIRM|nr:DnaB-like helicase C-terminal domain-containing protein [Fervidicola ferrireducens]KXG74915.1 DNA primase [Fervidicola ferrireducens]
MDELGRWLDKVYTRLDHAVFFGHLRGFRRAGNGYVACCPNHDDRHPSFWMPIGRPWGKCFACGHFTTWWKELENRGLKGMAVIKELSRLSGVPMPEAWREEKFTTAVRAREKLEEWWEGRRAALWAKEGEDVLGYLRSRGYTDDLIRRMDVGVHSGTRLAPGNLPLPRKEYRLLIPIRVPGGRIIGFVGRRPDNTKPKYMYSKGLNRSEILFGQHRLRPGVVPVVVEGILDVEALAAAGVEGVIGLGGALASPAQIQTLAGYKQLILGLDGDEAGQAGTEKLVQELAIRGVRTYVADLAGAKDPDELLRSAGPETVQAAFRHAVPGHKWLVWRWFSGVGSPVEKDRALMRAVDLAAKLNPILAAEFRAELAKRAGISVASLAEEIDRIRREQTREEAIRQAQAELARGNVEKAVEALNNLIITDATGTLEPVKFDNEEDLKAVLASVPSGIELPWPALTRFVRLMPGLTVVGAAVSAGKSTFLYNLALYLLQAAGVVVFWSGEVVRQIMLARMLSILVNKSVSEVLIQLNKGAMDADVWEGTRQLMALVNEKLYVTDEPLTVDELAMQVRAVAKHHKIIAIMVDYLQQLLPPSKNDGKYATREQEVTAIAQALHRLGTELGFPVVAAAQLSRNNFQYKERPKLTDLRESGGIEHYATTVLGLWNSTMAAAKVAAGATPAAPSDGWYWTPDGDSPEADSALALAASWGKTLLEVSVLKNRWHGNVGKTIPLGFDPATGRIEELPTTPGPLVLELPLEENVINLKKNGRR